MKHKTFLPMWAVKLLLAIFALLIVWALWHGQISNFSTLGF